MDHVPAPPIATLHLIGDSTMAIRPAVRPIASYGWGQVLPLFFEDGVIIANHARSGRSSKSFIDEGHWRSVEDRVQAGDTLIIQFGANDQKVDDPTRHAPPYLDYSENLGRFVRHARAKGAAPILATPICRRRFDRNGRFHTSNGDYPDAVRQLAALESVPLIDLQRDTEALLTALGPEQSKRLFWWVAPGLDPAKPEGREDNSHLSYEGARTVAAFAAEAIRAMPLAIAGLLKPTPNPSRPDQTW
jgi:lysophospholipase L1-like esterase